jgi:hypothetical protein
LTQEESAAQNRDRYINNKDESILSSRGAEFILAYQDGTWRTEVVRLHKEDANRTPEDLVFLAQDIFSEVAGLVYVGLYDSHVCCGEEKYDSDIKNH